MVQLDMRIHINEHQVTENMLGILSARILGEEPQNTAKTLNLYGTWLTSCAHCEQVEG